MKLALTLSSYISRQFFISFAIVTSVFSILIMMLDALELLRRASSKQIPIYILINMVLLKLPILLQVILPFVILVSAVLTYTSLARRSELVVIRSAGVSVWEFLTPSVISAFVIGLVVVLGVNPLSAIMVNKYQYLNAKYFENKQNLLDISESGLWFKQDYESLPPEAENEKRNEMIIHAEDISGTDNIRLKNIELMAFDYNDTFLFRVDSKSATLKDNHLSLENATITTKQNKVQTVPVYSIGTELKQADIEKSFNEPEAVSFFQLPSFIRKLENTGFSALAHILQLHKIMSSPFFYAAMVLIGAVFSLKAPRQGMIGYSITFSIIFGFVIYFVSNLISSIGLSGAIPVIIAAWLPVFITLLIGFGLLLHYEDG